MKIQLLLLSACLIVTACVGAEPELLPPGDATRDMARETSMSSVPTLPVGHAVAGQPVDGWVSRPVETVPYGFTTGTMSGCPHCHDADCCQEVVIQQMIWKSAMHPIEVWNWQLEDVGTKIVRNDKCENGVCTQTDCIVRQKKLVCHKSIMQVPGLVPATRPVRVQMCFKCKRTH